MLELNNENFEDEVIESNKPVVVDFWAEWCMPCKMLAPIFEEVSKDMKNIKFGKVDVDKNGDLAQKFFIQGIPAIVIFNKGEEIGRITGLDNKESLKKKIEAML